MYQACDVIEFTLTEGLHARNKGALRNMIGVLQADLVFVDRTVDHFDLLGEFNAFPQVADDLIHQKDDRRAVFLRKIEGAYRQLVAFLHRGGGQGDHGMIPVGAPASLHIVSLGRRGGQSGGGTAALYIHNYAGNFGKARIADILLLQREAGTGCGGHRLDSGGRSADHGRHAGNLVLHLNEMSVVKGQLQRRLLGNFRGRGNRISCKKTHSGGKCALNYRFISLKQHTLSHLCILLSVFLKIDCIVGTAQFALTAENAASVLLEPCLFIHNFQSTFRAKGGADPAALAPKRVDDQMF